MDLKGEHLATIYQTQRKRKDPATGKKVLVFDKHGQPVMHPKWRTTIFDHNGVRKTFTLTGNKLQSQKQADQIELREKEIKNGLRAAPEKKPEVVKRPFEEVFAEYMAWGRAQGGRRNLPWDDEHAYKKERDIKLWRDILALEDIADAADILTKVEAECRKMLDDGKSGKTVSNRVQNLRALFLWCKKRKYLNDNPLQELGGFDTEPTFVRRAMTLEEFTALMAACAAHRRLLYEVAACSGLRENELRQLEPRHLDRKHCAIRIERRVDKGRQERRQPIPAALMERLEAFVAAGEAKKLYARIYRNQGKRAERKQPPVNPLLYVPANSATMLKKDLARAGVPVDTEEGRIDFHALRTAYINFLMDVGATPKTTQSLARHATLEMTMNVYGRAREDNRRGAVEALGEMLFAAPNGLADANNRLENDRISTEPLREELEVKNITPGNSEGYIEKYWCGREDLNLHDLAAISS